MERGSPLREAGDEWNVGDLPEGLRVEASDVWDVGDQRILQHEQPPVYLLRDGHQVPDSSIKGGCRRQTGKVAQPIATRTMAAVLSQTSPWQKLIPHP